MDLNKKRVHYLKINKDTTIDKTVLEKNLEIDIVAEWQSNNVVILEAHIHIDEDTEPEVNDKKNEVELEKEI